VGTLLQCRVIVMGCHGAAKKMQENANLNKSRKNPGVCEPYA